MPLVFPSLPSTYTLHALLRGPVVLLVREDHGPEGFLDEWVERCRHFFQLPPGYPSESAVFLDAHTGRSRGAVYLPTGQLQHARLFPEHNTVFLAFHQADQLLCLEYDADLPKPWRFILLGGAIAFAAITLLQETWRGLRYLVRRRLSARHAAMAASVSA